MTSLIYIGVRLSPDNKTKSFCYTPLLDSQFDLESIIHFKKKLNGLEVIGTIIESEVEGNKYKGNQIVGQVSKDDEAYKQISFWSIQSRASQEKYERIREAAKPHPKSIEGMVEEIRWSMSAMSSKDRAALALWIFNKLT